MISHEEAWKLIEDRKVDEKGYIKVRTKEGWIYEHRLIVELFIGRKLKDEEVVHHLNSCRQDNRISNLMIFPSQKEHSAFHVKFNKFGWSRPIRLQIQNRWKNYKEVKHGTKTT